MEKNRKYIVWVGVIAILFVGYFIANSYLFNGVKPRVIYDSGFHANYFVKKETEKKASIVLIGGGQWGDYWGQEFANRGFSGLSLPYTQRDGLPKLPEEINLEYFEKAISWLKKQPEVDPKKIVIMGASRNAELALVIASTFPDLISGVVAYSPSSVSWSNTVLPYNSNDIKSSWKYQGVDIPYVPMNKFSGSNSNKIETLEYWNSGLVKTDYVTQATIKVENIKGPILLFSGRDDMVWHFFLHVKRKHIKLVMIALCTYVKQESLKLMVGRKPKKIYNVETKPCFEKEASVTMYFETSRSACFRSVKIHV